MAEKASEAPATKRIALVTGANKGIGLEICRQLASHGLTVILTARDEKRGTAAAEQLKSSGLNDVLFHQLDVADPSSVDSLAGFIKTKFGKLDILVNNAGVGGLTLPPEALAACKAEEDVNMRLWKYLGGVQETYQEAEECFNINYYGLKRVTEALIPLLQQSDLPKIVNVSSAAGKLHTIPGENKRKEFEEIDKLTEEKLDELLKSFLIDFKAGGFEANGWPPKMSSYILSKVAVNCYTRILARKYPTICINCVHPGFVKTDINYNLGVLTAEEGAKGAVMLALLPGSSPSGLFYDQTEVSSFN